MDAKANRDAALDQVEEPAWSLDAFNLMLKALPKGWEGTGEDLRLLLTGLGLRRPHHHNCWGSLVMNLVRQDHLSFTGRTENMRTSKSHARLTRVYRWL